jgi:trans-AT polyketide synthase/acyltransferase/oxidoreductase domain-containing protein
MVTHFRFTEKIITLIDKVFPRSAHTFLMNTPAPSCLMFPGQGSQYKGMGRELFDRFPHYVEIADGILGYSIRDLCLADAGQDLQKTRFTQPALYVVNALSYLAWLQDKCREPDYLIGHSLGEYNALLASGVFDFQTGLRIVIKRGLLFEAVKSGGMLAVMGASTCFLRSVLERPEFGAIDIASRNCETQIILSGPVNDLKRVEMEFRMPEIKTLFLNVSGGFHSRQMAPVKEEFGSFLETFSFKEPRIPVFSNVDAILYDREKVSRLLADQLVSPLCWQQQLYHLFDKGVVEFTELGPGNVLAKLLLYNRKQFDRSNTGAAAQKSRLGSSAFKKRYGVRYAYVAGGMYAGIASEELVLRMARAGFLSFLGTGGQSIASIEASLDLLRQQLGTDYPFGINFLHDPSDAEAELHLARLCITKGARIIEASAFGAATQGLVYFRLKGIKRDGSGKIVYPNHIVAKLSRPEVASVFLSPPPVHLVRTLTDRKWLSPEEAALAPHISLASDITVEADSGGHTDGGVLLTLLPAIILLRNSYARKFNFPDTIHIGAAGGIGTPQAIAAAFMLGADYVLTGSINQCTVEAGTSSEVKDLLSQMNIQDTSYAPAGDMFELGAKVQVLKKGVLFPNRANRLYDLYRNHESIDAIDQQTRGMLEEKYFKKSLQDIWHETRLYILSTKANLLSQIESAPKLKMAAIFKWYFHKSTQYSLTGNNDNKMDYQIHCGPALGSFNQWVAGTDLADWRKRHVDEIAVRLMEEAERLFRRRE